MGGTYVVCGLERNLCCHIRVKLYKIFLEGIIASYKTMIIKAANGFPHLEALRAV